MYTEEYIRSNPDKVDWYDISIQQKLSENFIREFQNKLDWDCISKYQKLTGDFIIEFQDKVSWIKISYSQKLSESFIREFQNKVNWYFISYNQKLSKEFMKEFEDKVNKEEQLKTHHNELSLQEKQELIQKYCDKYNLKYDDNYLYAYRNHDKNGSGIFNKTIIYEKNKYYRDWRCDLNPEHIISFGYGINTRGNTKVKVKIEDIGCWVNYNDKLRVWGFEII